MLLNMKFENCRLLTFRADYFVVFPLLCRIWLFDRIGIWTIHLWLVRRCVQLQVLPTFLRLLDQIAVLEKSWQHNGVSNVSECIIDGYCRACAGCPYIILGSSRKVRLRPFMTLYIVQLKFQGNPWTLKWVVTMIRSQVLTRSAEGCWIAVCGVHRGQITGNWSSGTLRLFCWSHIVTSWTLYGGWHPAMSGNQPMNTLWEDLAIIK
jgi:hypothetical protein